MKFYRGRTYTHKNMLDMVIYVYCVTPVNEEYTNLKVKWFNRRGLDINQEETVKIKNSDFNNWYEWKGQKI